MPIVKLSYSKQFLSGIDVTCFECEPAKQGYAEFLRNADEALRYRKENYGITYLFYTEENDLAGYVTISMGHLNKAKLINNSEEDRKPTNIPGLFLGHLVRDIKFKGKGIGDQLVDWVKSKAYELSQQVGCRLIILESELDVVKSYEGRKFVAVPQSRQDRARHRQLMYYDLGIRETES